MTHKPNRTNLPPAKSADEYERELAALRARVEELEGARESAWNDGWRVGAKDANELKGISTNPFTLAASAALSPKGEA